MRTPPYPCAYCGRRGIPHPSSICAQCVDCAWKDEYDRALAEATTREFARLVLILALTLAFFAWVYWQAGR